MKQKVKLRDLIDLVQSVAWDYVMPRFQKVRHRKKKDGTLVTEADFASQDAFERLLPRLCSAPVIGEEMSEEAQLTNWKNGSAEGVWCVDPLDGTSNFANGVPYFALSVALLKRGKPVLGVVFDPIGKEIFSAREGEGAYLNGERLILRDEKDKYLCDVMAGADFKRLPKNLREALGKKPPYRSHRNFGASTLEWCYLAAGRFDVYLHGGQKLWDYSAGALILEEAGGYLSSIDNDDFWEGDPWRRSVVAASGKAIFQDWRLWVRNNTLCV